jgi:hypothetical protein
MNGIQIAEATHVINALPAVSISGGKTTVPFSMAGAEHASIILSFGASAALPTSFILKQATTQAAGTNSALGFRFYYQATSGAGNDTLLGPFYADTTGITSTLPASAPLPAGGVASLMFIIEIDAAELEPKAAVVGTIVEYPYLELVIADSGNVTIGSCIVILSGLRYAYKGSPTATV